MGSRCDVSAESARRFALDPELTRRDLCTPRQEAKLDSKLDPCSPNVSQKSREDETAATTSSWEKTLAA